MLTYEEKDSKWENWDGGYWGKDIYKKKNSSNFSKCCCITFILCLMLFMITLSIIYIITEGQFICSITYVKKVDFCINHDKKLTNNTNIQNQTTIFDVTNTNKSSISNDTKYINDINEKENQNNFISNNNSLSQLTQHVNKTNYTNYMLYRENIQNQIENSKESSINEGEAIAISIGSVFGFIL